MLHHAVQEAIQTVSQPGGFGNNPAIHIPMPPELEGFEKKLRTFHMGGKCDEMIASVNRSAEKAAPNAVDPICNGVEGLKVSEGISMLKGGNGACTRILKNDLLEPLKAVFKPFIDGCLDSEGGVKAFEDLRGYFNKLPFVTHIDFDIHTFVLTKALDGIFHMVEQEENKIRANPSLLGADVEKIFKMHM